MKLEIGEETKEHKRSYPKKWWNPNLVEFLEVNDDKTLIGFAWSCYWRLSIVMMAVWFLAYIVLGSLALIIGSFS